MKLKIFILTSTIIWGCATNPDIKVSYAPPDVTRCVKGGWLSLGAESESHFISLAKKEMMKSGGNFLYLMELPEMVVHSKYLYRYSAQIYSCEKI